MWKSVPATVTSGFRFITARTFLSNAYKCTDDWNARLTAPVLQKIKPEKFYYELEQKFLHHGKCSAIDIDIFANRLTGHGYLEEVADLVHRHRLTEETTNTFESTGHAVIRCYLDHAEHKDLFDILNDRLSYGVFLDSFTANLALDKFIQAKDYTSAARIASFMMLEEDFTNPITRALSLYACIKYLQNVQPFEVPAVDTSATEEVAATQKTPASKKKKEEIRVRVGYLRNDFFDDHFDLRDGQKLVGKTMAMIGKSFGSTEIGRTAQLLGLYNFGKYTQATELLSSDSCGFYKDAVDAILAHTEAVTDSTDVEFLKFAESLKTIAAGEKCLTDNFEKVVCGLAHNIVAAQEPADITAQKKVRHLDIFHFSYVLIIMIVLDICRLVRTTSREARRRTRTIEAKPATRRN